MLDLTRLETDFNGENGIAVALDNFPLFIDELRRTRAKLKDIETVNGMLKRGSEAAMRITEKANEDRDAMAERLYHAMDERETLRKELADIHAHSGRQFASMEDIRNMAYAAINAPRKAT